MGFGGTPMKVKICETAQALGRRAPLNMDFDTMRAAPEDQEGVVATETGKKLRLKYEHARKVEMEVVDGDHFEFTRCPGGYWEMNLDQPGFFCYVRVIVDGDWVLSPYLPIGYGDNHPMNFLDTGEPDGASDSETAPRGDDAGCRAPFRESYGTLCQERYTAHLTGETKSLYIYTPPGYMEGGESYPVLYLQHGYGENELGWIYQGRVAQTADRLISHGEMEPMLIVMADGMMRFPGGNGEIIHKPEKFTEELLEDIMPLVERHYRVRPGSDARAIAGLSMGSLQTSITICTYPGMFAWAGVFSGFMSNVFDGHNEHLEKLKSGAEEFNKSTRLLFRAMGKDDRFWERFEKDDRFCGQYGINCVRKVYEGAHTWNVWRQCIEDFLPMLFRE